MELLAIVMISVAGICIILNILFFMFLVSLLAWFNHRENSELEKDEMCMKDRKETEDDFPEIPDYEPEFQSYKTCVCSSKNCSIPRLLPRMRLPGSLGYEEPEIQTKLKPVVLRTEIRMNEKVIAIEGNKII